MQVLDVVNRVKLLSHRGDQTITNDKITTDILNCINLSWEDLCQLLPRQAFRTDSIVNSTDIVTVQGIDIYSMVGNPYPVQELIIVHYSFNGNNYNLQKIESEREFWNKFFYQSASQNRPYVYCPWGFDSNGVKQIRIFPIPDIAYTLHYSFYVDPTSIDFRTQSLTSNIPFLPTYLQFALWRGTLYYFLKAFDDPGQTVALADYEKAKVRQDISEDADMDGDTQFRFDNMGNRFVDPVTGIRLQKL